MTGEKYFERYNLGESLILRYVFDKNLKTVEIVFDLTDRALSGFKPEGQFASVRELHKLIFFGISDYERSDIGKLHEKHTGYLASSTNGAISMYEVEHTESEFKTRLTDFGTVSFKYESFTFDILEIEISDSRREGEDRYRNVLTKEAVDFYNAFSD